MKNMKKPAVIFAILAAVFYALNAPLSKLLLKEVPSALMAGFLYLGAGAGIGVLYCFRIKGEDRSARLSRKDLPYTLGMILLDIAAPVLLMRGIRLGTASSASLLGNFEIVATTVIAYVFFRERISGRLITAIVLITAASVILSFENESSLEFSAGSLLVLLAACCWGLENNCTRSISGKSTYEIVTLKGIFSGLGSLCVGLLAGEKMPPVRFILPSLLLGFVAYGLSIFLYVRAQRELGAAKTSAFYAVAPFIGAFLSFVILGDRLPWTYAAALVIMIAGTAFVTADTLHPRKQE
ncbi:MAG: EamA/RhaT family transporter [Clostridiales bacterium]|nr:EamA/RhaT family transporter [Clostridiales bacterium]